jgi:4-hydroxy-4-methyl-2-oxoglutarate aldolase
MPADRSDPAPDPLVARLAKLDTGQVSDVLDEAGLANQVVASVLVPLKPQTRFAGRAACVSGEPIISTLHGPPPLPADILEQVVGVDRILVIGVGGFSAGSVLGGFVAYSLQREGCRGVITDGAIRDAEEIRGLDFPVVCASVNPINGARRWRLTKYDVPVSLPGQTGAPVLVRPLDLILADADGVVVVPAEVAEQVIADSEELLRIEQQIGRELRGGARRVDAFNNNPRFKHIRKI